MSQLNCHAVPEFMFFLIWLRRPYPSKVGLSISKLPYLTLPYLEPHNHLLHQLVCVYLRHVEEDLPDELKLKLLILEMILNLQSLNKLLQALYLQLKKLIRMALVKNLNSDHQICHPPAEQAEPDVILDQPVALQPTPLWRSTNKN